MNHSLSAIEGTYRPVNFTLLQIRTCANFKKWVKKQLMYLGHEDSQAYIWTLYTQNDYFFFQIELFSKVFVFSFHKDSRTNEMFVYDRTE